MVAKGEPALPTRISTENYIEAFKKFREANYGDSGWNAGVHGKDFIKGFNGGVLSYQKEAADSADEASKNAALLMVLDNRDDYDNKVKAKHGSVKTKIRNDHLKALNLSYGITKMPKQPWDYSSLSQAQREEHGSKKRAYEAEINNLMPSLPSYDGTRKTRKTVTGQKLLEMLR
jgi:hypothetical protein